MIEISSIGKSYGALKAISDISLTVAKGEFVTLLGPSGCGKTTTLRCVAGLEYPDIGRISIGERNVTDAASGFFLPPNERGIGMVFQSYAVWPHMTVGGNVSFPLRVARRPGNDIKGAVEQALGMVGLAGYADRSATLLSGGQQQRVALARALVANPATLLFDEPLSNLDAKLRVQMRQEIRDLQRRLGASALYVTHDQVEALSMSDRVVVMHNGSIVQIGTPKEIYNRPATAFVASFVGAANLIDIAMAGAEGEFQIARSGELAFRIRGPISATTGRLMIRPERIRLGRWEDFGKSEDTNVLKAEVESVAFTGVSYEISVRVGGIPISVVAQDEFAGADAIAFNVDDALFMER